MIRGRPPGKLRGSRVLESRGHWTDGGHKHGLSATARKLSGWARDALGQQSGRNMGGALWPTDCGRSPELLYRINVQKQ